MANQIDTRDLEAAVFRRLVKHLQGRTDVQNIDMMTLAGFCRNCLSNWMEEAAAQLGGEMSRAEAREAVYGMPYEDWKRQFQKEATTEQSSAFQIQPKNNH